MKKMLIIILFSLVGLKSVNAQSTTLLAYDANGNRVRKQLVGSSPHPTVTASPEAVNPNQPSTLVASGCPGTVQWQPVNQTGNQITVNPAATTQYTAQCVVNGCANNGFAKATVSLIQCSTVQLTTGRQPEGNIRLGQNVTLYAFGCNNGTVSWSSGQVGTPITVQITSASNSFTATCQKDYCLNLGSSSVSVAGYCPTYPLTVASSAIQVRYGQFVTLSAAGCNGGSINWSSGQVSNPFAIQIYGPSNRFSAVCSDSYCPNMGSSGITITGVTGCAAGDVLLTARAGNWTDPGTWACGRVPTISDEVYLNHEVQVNANGSTKGIILGSGFLNYPNSSFITVPQN